MHEYTAVLSGGSSRKRERELASEERAGAWSRRRAKEMQYRYVRRHWRKLGLLIPSAVVPSPAALLLPEPWSFFVLGAWAATFVAMGVHIVVVMSGSAYLIAADLGEQWTRRELDPLRRSEWRIIHRVLFRQAEDIDHIALGPAGLFVIETKWSSNDWTSTRQRARLLESVEQARENARITRLFLRAHLGDVTTTPVVVLWPSDGRMQEREIKGVTVLPGDQLTGWLKSRPAGVLEDEGVVRGWTAVSEHLSRRDAADLERSGPPPRGVWEYLWDLVQLPLGALTGVVASAWLATPLDWPLSLVPALLLATMAGFAARSEPVWRRLLQGVAVGSAIVFSVLLSVALLAILPG